jgi:hypothetical protein
MQIRRLPAKAILRAMLLVAVLAVIGLSAGAAVPETAMADDDDNGNNGGNYQICTAADGGQQTETVVEGVVVAVTQTCTITIAEGPKESCFQHATAPVVKQTCIFTQEAPVPVTNNVVKVTQIADQNGAEGTLDAEQKVRGHQSNTTGNNISNVTQVIDQKLASGIDDDDDGFDDDDNGEADEDDDGEPDDDNGEENGLPELSDEIIQNEQAHQWVDICQGGTDPCATAEGMSGRNESRVSMSETQLQFAANADDVFQLQNFEERIHAWCSPGPGPQPDDPSARECYTVQQHTTKSTGSSRSSCPSSSSSSWPANLSCLKQRSNQLQVARNVGDGHQGQGFSQDSGGLDHSFVQMSLGIALVFSDQEEHQTQKRTDTGVMQHHQLGGLRKGSGIQEDHEDNLESLHLLKVQDNGTGGTPDGDDGDDNGDDNGDENGLELSTLQYEGEFPSGQVGSARAFAETSGDCIADVTVTQNGQGKTAREGSDPGAGSDFCAEFVLCGNFEGFPSPPEGDNCASSDDPCPPGTARDPETGLCEPVGCPDEICVTGTNSPGVLGTEP